MQFDLYKINIHNGRLGGPLRQINISILQENARISNIELADRIGLSASACLRRVYQLEKDNLITGYHAVQSGEAGHSVLVLVHITLQGQSKDMLSDFETAVASASGSSLLSSGEESDYLLRVAAKDVADYGRIHSDFLTVCPCDAHGKQFCVA